MIITFIIAPLLIFGLWVIIYKLFTTDSKSTVAAIAAIIAVIATPSIFNFSVNFNATLSKMFFERNASGDVQLAYTPMRIPDSIKRAKKDSEYCRQFKDQNGNVLNIISVRDDGIYCGSYVGFYKDKYLTIPFKLLANGNAEYWASPQLKIVGKAPEFVGTNATVNKNSNI